MSNIYGQCVVGSPGSGKTTYCSAMKQFCQAVEREVCLINLDPANDVLIHEPCDPSSKDLYEQIDMHMFDIDIRDLITVEEIMEEYGLGPNGALLYSLKFIYDNIDWLIERINKIVKDGSAYVIFDCPGQVELFSVETEGGFKKLLDALTNPRGKLKMHLTAVNCMDSTLIVNVPTYVSALMVSLNTQIMLELPAVNIFTKMDLLKNMKKELGMPLENYLCAESMDLLLVHDESLDERRRRFLIELFEVVDDSNLVSFYLVDIHDKQSMMDIIRTIDISNGLFYNPTKLKNLKNTFEYNLVTGHDPIMQQIRYRNVIERYMDSSEDEPNE